VRAAAAIREKGEDGRDVTAAQALPRDLRDWRPSVEFVLGPFGCGKDLDEISAQDFARAVERDADAFCQQGFGALLARLAEGLPVRLSTAARRVGSWGRAVVDIETTRGWVRGRALIVTVSTNVLAADKIKFEPPLPKRVLEAAAKLTLGSSDRVALELDGNPLGLEKDELVFEKAGGARTAALLANVSGTPLCTLDIGGKFGRSLAAQGEAAMVAFATDWLAGLFGNDVRKAIKRTHATQWSKEPWVMGGSSAAPPGGQAFRRAFSEPFRDRIFFAGEAAHETLWGTVGGAWESGERAADAALRRVGGPVRRR
jgi:monoamine oxidase